MKSCPRLQLFCPALSEVQPSPSGRSWLLHSHNKGNICCSIHPTITHGTLTASSWICKNNKDPICRCRSLLEGFYFPSKTRQVQSSQCPSSMSPPQKTLPALESQIRDTLHETLQDLQRYNRGTPQTEAEKLFFLTDVSITICHRAEQGGNCETKRNSQNICVGHWEVCDIHHCSEGNIDKPHLQK